MANFWDERYSAEEYIFGKEPNVFFQIRDRQFGTWQDPCSSSGRRRT